MQMLEKSLHSLRYARLVASLLVCLTVVGCADPEQQLADYLASADSLLQTGNYSKAGVQYRNALAIDQNNLQALNGLAEVSIEEGNAKAAFQHYSVITELDPTNVTAQLFVGRAFLASEMPDRALERGSLLLQLAPDNAEVHSFRALVFRELDHVDAALVSAKAALQIDATVPPALMVLAEDRLANNDYQTAIELIDQGLSADEYPLELGLLKVSALYQTQDVEAALAEFEKLVTFHPNDPTLRTRYAAYLLLDGRTDAAETALEDMVALQPAEIEPKLRLIRFLLEWRGLEAALAKLESYIDQTTETFALRFRRGELYAASGQIEKAATEYDAILSEAGTSAEGLQARSRLGQLALASNDRATAQQLVRQVLAEDERNVEGLLLRASLHTMDEEYDEAVSVLRTVLAEEATSAAALVGLARIHDRIGQRSLADDYYARAVGTNPRDAAIAIEYARYLINSGSLTQADTLLAELSDRFPTLLTALQLRAQVKLSLKQWAAAEALALRLAGTESQDASVYQVLGVALQGQQRYAESIPALLKAHEAFPDAPEPIVALVRAYVEEDRRNDALVFLQSVPARSGDTYTANLLLARLHASAEDFDAAESAFEKAIGIDPGRSDAYRELGALRRLRGDVTQSAATLESGVEAVPADPSLKVGLALTYERAGKFEAAIAQYQEVVDLQPENLVARNNLASLLSEADPDPERLARALELAGPLVDSDLPQFQDTLGWVYHKLGRHDEALAILEEVVREAPAVAAFHYHLGMVQLRRGDAEQARRSLEQAIALGEQSPFPGYEESKSVLESL